MASGIQVRWRYAYFDYALSVRMVGAWSGWKWVEQEELFGASLHTGDPKIAAEYQARTVFTEESEDD